MMIELCASRLSLPDGVTTPEAALESLSGSVALSVRRDLLMAREFVPVGILALRLSLWVPMAPTGSGFEFRDDASGQVLLGIKPQGFGWRVWSDFSRRLDKRTWPISEVTLTAREFINQVSGQVRDDHGVNLGSRLAGWGTFADAITSRAS